MTHSEIQDALARSIAENPAPLPDSIARAVFTIYGSPYYAPASANLLAVLDDSYTPPQKKIWPPESYADWSEVTDTTKHIIKRIGKLEPWTPKLFLRAVDGFEADADTLSELRVSQKQIDDENAELEKWSSVAADAAYAAQSRETAQKIPSGPLGADHLHQRDSMRFSYKQKRDAVNLRIELLVSKARSLAAPMIAKALNFVRLNLVVREDGERNQADDFGLPWVPSNIWRAHAAIMIQVRPERVNREISPRKMLEGVVEL